MATISLPQPSIGQPVSTEDPKIVALLAALTTEVNDRELAFTTWKPLLERRGYLSSAVAATVYMFTDQSALMTALNINASPQTDAFPLDPADFTAGTRTTQLRLRVMWRTNVVAPTVTFEPALYPITGYTGLSGSVPSISTVGPRTPSSALSITTPSASTGATADTSAFTCPAAGPFLLGVAASGTQAANSVISFVAQLQYRQT